MLLRDAASEDLEDRSAAEKQVVESSNDYLTPDQSQLIRTFKNKTPVKLRGTLQSVRASGSGKTIYLIFSKPR